MTGRRDAVTGDVTLHTRVNGRRHSPERNYGDGVVYSKGALGHMSRDEKATGYIDRIQVAAYQMHSPEYTSVIELLYQTTDHPGAR